MTMSSILACNLEDFSKENKMEMCYMINGNLEDSEMFQPTNVLDRTYNRSFNANEAVSQHTHLTKEPHFSGKVGCYPHKKSIMDIPPEAHPIQQRPYPIS